jgi:hypothetical protein
MFRDKRTLDPQIMNTPSPPCIHKRLNNSTHYSSQIKYPDNMVHMRHRDSWTYIVGPKNKKIFNIPIDIIKTNGMDNAATRLHHCLTSLHDNGPKNIWKKCGFQHFHSKNEDGQRQILAGHKVVLSHFLISISILTSRVKRIRINSLPSTDSPPYRHPLVSEYCYGEMNLHVYGTVSVDHIGSLASHQVEAISGWIDTGSTSFSERHQVEAISGWILAPPHSVSATRWKPYQGEYWLHLIQRAPPGGSHIRVNTGSTSFSERHHWQTNELVYIQHK